MLQRRPAQRSGGQRQRVAMGRAIVREPKAFLMDEPLSNLDAKLRVSMRAELAKLHERLRVTTVYVTHDQVEAMTLGQRVAVLRDGLLQQVDTPQKLFHNPTNLFVAAFIGSPSMNLIDADVRDGQVSFADVSFQLPETSPALHHTGRLIVGIRPTDFEHGESADSDILVFTSAPDVVEDLGSGAPCDLHARRAASPSKPCARQSTRRRRRALRRRPSRLHRVSRRPAQGVDLLRRRLAIDHRRALLPPGDGSRAERRTAS
jgi:multiple sugar transport system ATP-binding protein